MRVVGDGGWRREEGSGWGKVFVLSPRGGDLALSGTANHSSALRITESARAAASFV
jgi:hypothetical protein